MVRCAIIGDGFICRIQPLWNSTTVPVLTNDYQCIDDTRDTVQFFCRDRMSVEAMLTDDVLRQTVFSYSPELVVFHLGREDIYNDTSATVIFEKLARLQHQFCLTCYDTIFCEIPRSVKVGVDPISYARQRRIINHRLHQHYEFLHFRYCRYDPNDPLHSVFGQADLMRYCESFQRKVERACEKRHFYLPMRESMAVEKFC